MFPKCGFSKGFPQPRAWYIRDEVSRKEPFPQILSYVCLEDAAKINWGANTFGENYLESPVSTQFLSDSPY